jgi:SAM-dependent methyltransferase
MTANPWLAIPAADYEGHMGESGVDQLGPLRRIFEQVYRNDYPMRVAVLGCGPGGGLDVIEPFVTERFVGVDLNPEYLSLARQRHPHLSEAAEWICAHVEQCAFEAASLDLIHAALLFEYVDPSVVLPQVARWLSRGGILSVILQLPGGDAPISETRFSSLQQLSGLMRLVPPDRLCDLATRAGLTLRSSTEIPLARGKRFWAGTFARP